MNFCEEFTTQTGIRKTYDDALKLLIEKHEKIN